MKVNADSSRNTPVEHGVEGGNFIYTHWWHLEKVGDVVHDAYGCPSLVLTLTEVKEGDDSRLLVLGRVVGDDFLCALEVLGGELEGDLCRVRGVRHKKYIFIGHTLGLL